MDCARWYIAIFFLKNVFICEHLLVYRLVSGGKNREGVPLNGTPSLYIK